MIGIIIIMLVLGVSSLSMIPVFSSGHLVAGIIGDVVLLVILLIVNYIIYILTILWSPEVMKTTIKKL